MRIGKLTSLGVPVLALSLFLIAVVYVHSTCAGWMPVSGPYLSQDGFQVEMPEGWMLRTAVEDELFLTRDGSWLQFVRIARARLERPKTSSKLAKDTQPLQAAEIVASEFRALAGVVNFQVVESFP